MRVKHAPLTIIRMKTSCCFRASLPTLSILKSRLCAHKGLLLLHEQSPGSILMGSVMTKAISIETALLACILTSNISKVGTYPSQQPHEKHIKIRHKVRKMCSFKQIKSTTLGTAKYVSSQHQ